MLVNRVNLDVETYIWGVNYPPTATFHGLLSVYRELTNTSDDPPENDR